MKHNPIITDLVKALKDVSLKHKDDDALMVSTGFIQVALRNMEKGNIETYFIEIDGRLCVEGSLVNHEPLDENLVEDTIKNIQDENEKLKIELRK